MKRESPTQTAMSLFMALFVATMLTLAGCSAGALSGPDLETTPDATVQEAPSSYSPGASHTEEEEAGKKKSKSNGGGSVKGNAPHNSG